MADLLGSVYELDDPGSGPFPQTYLPGTYYGLTSTEGGVIVTKYFKMRAIDSDQTDPPRYITWIVTDEPAFDGAGYLGGEPTPVGSMVEGSAVVMATWEEWRE